MRDEDKFKECVKELDARFQNGTPKRMENQAALVNEYLQKVHTGKYQRERCSAINLLFNHLVRGVHKLTEHSPNLMARDLDVIADFYGPALDAALQRYYDNVNMRSGQQPGNIITLGIDTQVEGFWRDLEIVFSMRSQFPQQGFDYRPFIQYYDSEGNTHGLLIAEMQLPK
ncbi:TPA: hypothetical protein HA265_00925 [Candidatus Woesearchaeota archaeon]|nr:hypothetical protein [Candidatus Woesearchaeota archaeon]